MAIDETQLSSTATIAAAKTKLKALLQSQGTSAADAARAADGAMDALGRAIIEAVIEELQDNPQ